MQPQRTCSQCGATLVPGKNGHGLCSRCYLAVWQQNNRDRCHAYGLRWRERYPERAKQIRDDYKAANKEKTKAASALYYQRNKDAERARGKAHYAAHKEMYATRSKRNHELRPEIWRAAYFRRQTRMANAFVERVLIEPLYERDKGICGICGRRVSLQQATIDHILPIAHGGEHSYRNTRIAHRGCNSGRRDRGAAQLRLLA